MADGTGDAACDPPRCAGGVQGFEHFVGTKTTFRISNGEHLGFRESDETVLHQLRSKSFLIKLLWFDIKFHEQVSDAAPLFRCR